MIAAALCGGLHAALYAAPYVPQTGAEVLERLRERPLDPSSRELRALRRELARDPRNLELAVRVARRYIQEARAQGDPRFLGYAQATLSPWWEAPQPPVPVLLLRAVIRQSQHDFGSALSDLAQIIKADPANAQAWLTRATILQVKAEYAEAERSCEALRAISSELVWATCSTGVLSMTGQAEASYRALRALTERTGTGSAAEKVWAETTLAEIATRLDRRQDAETHFNRAFKLGPPDPYLKAAYADFLIDSGRPAEVVRLIGSDTRVDGLMLRLALAEQVLASSELPQRIATLKSRFDASRLRGDRVHQREESWFNTALLKQPREGLRLAQANWSVQKEPADARVLLEAALAARERGAAQPAIEWMRRNKVEDAALERLVRRIEGAS